MGAQRALLWAVLLVVLMLVFAACSASDSDGDDAPDPATPARTTTRAPSDTATAAAAVTPEAPAAALPPADPPPIPTGPISEALADDLGALLTILFVEEDPLRLQGIALIRKIGASEDPRVSWILLDALRFLPGNDTRTEVIRDALTQLTNVEYEQPWWVAASNQLIAWDVPAPPDYVRWKRVPYEWLYDRWAPFFDDEAALFDYRYLTWGGVLTDTRPPPMTSRPDGSAPAASRRCTTPPSRTRPAGAGIRTLRSSSGWSWATRRAPTPRT